MQLQSDAIEDIRDQILKNMPLSAQQHSEQTVVSTVDI